MINFDRIFLSKFGKKLNKTLNKNMNSKLPSDYKSVLDINSRKRYKISPDSYLNNSGLEIDIKQSLSQRIEEAKIENFINNLDNNIEPSFIMLVIGSERSGESSVNASIAQ